MLGCHTEPRNARRHRLHHDRFASPELERTEEKIGFVERLLGITDRQRDAWERLADAMRDSAEVMAIARTAVHETEPNTMVRLARIEDVADVAAAAFRRVRPALEGLYTTLDDTQCRKLDALVTHGSARSFWTGV